MQINIQNINTKISDISSKRQNNILPFKNNVCPNFTSTVQADNGQYGKALVYMSQMDKLKADTNEFPQDIEYRKNLLINAGLSPANQHKIRSIIGTQELKSIMKEFNEDERFYSAGENMQNVKDYGIRANLHIHTIVSDGRLNVHELLDKAAEYADDAAKNNPDEKVPFVIAITDHDTLESSQEAIRTIYENPIKYKNLKVVLGVEMTTYNNIGVDIVHKPTNTHVLAYGIDPNEKTFTSFIDGVKAKKQNLEYMVMDTANETYEKYYGKNNFFDLNQAKVQFNQLNKNITGIWNNLDMYFRNKIAVEHIVMENDKIKNALKENNMPTTTDEFMDKFSEFKCALDGNNKVYPPEDTLPEFISACTDMDKDEVTDIIIQGLKEEKISALNKELRENISKYKVTLTPQYKYMPAFSDLYNGLKDQKQAIIGIAHPLDTVSRIKDSDDRYLFLEDLYSKFKDECKEKATFTEVYYQSYNPELRAFKEDNTTRKFMNDISKKYGLYKTGSQDTHGRNLFQRY